MLRQETRKDMKMADKSVTSNEDWYIDFLNQDSGGIGNPMLDLRREKLKPTRHGVKNLSKLARASRLCSGIRDPSILPRG